MAYVSRTTDPECRDQLAALHRLITEARSVTASLIAAKLDGLEWVDACLSDAASDVVGIVNNSEPMSAR